MDYLTADIHPGSPAELGKVVDLLELFSKGDHVVKARSAGVGEGLE